jgi:uncharacterized protein YciU (UPF0263 family)
MTNIERFNREIQDRINDWKTSFNTKSDSELHAEVVILQLQMNTLEEVYKFRKDHKA